MDGLSEPRVCSIHNPTPRAAGRAPLSRWKPLQLHSAGSGRARAARRSDETGAGAEDGVVLMGSLSQRKTFSGLVPQSPWVDSFTVLRNFGLDSLKSMNRDMEEKGIVLRELSGRTATARVNRKTSAAVQLPDTTAGAAGLPPKLRRQSGRLRRRLDCRCHAKFVPAAKFVPGSVIHT
ncbi:unnamed protein product [Boreogadus saida]